MVLLHGYIQVCVRTRGFRPLLSVDVAAIWRTDDVHLVAARAGWQPNHRSLLGLHRSFHKLPPAVRVVRSVALACPTARHCLHLFDLYVFCGDLRRFPQRHRCLVLLYRLIAYRVRGKLSDGAGRLSAYAAYRILAHCLLALLRFRLGSHHAFVVKAGLPNSRQGLPGATVGKCTTGEQGRLSVQRVCARPYAAYVLNALVHLLQLVH
mmetsp:Transcript_12499/g.26352  ORF Transcript_12499/g.26352 Transcript_12499/m.26352 type:complete len:208 (+) Transcript_12499:202-825(+)